MSTILADSFTAALAKLSNDEQKQAKLTAFDLQTNPDHPGLQFHRIDKSRDPNWSVRVSRDLRIIIHKTASSVMLAYVAHHDDAYHWAERRRIETHPKTGAIQIVEVRERVEEAVVATPPIQAELSLALPAVPLAPIFGTLTRTDPLSVGVPEDWVSDVAVASEDGFFGLAAHLPQTKAAASAGVTEFTSQFLYSEWTHVIDAWQIEAYAAVPRMGRKDRLGARQRELLWQVFSSVREGLAARALTTRRVYSRP